jgi:hypothetical protein
MRVISVNPHPGFGPAGSIKARRGVMGRGGRQRQRRVIGRREIGADGQRAGPGRVQRGAGHREAGSDDQNRDRGDRRRDRCGGGRSMAGGQRAVAGRLCGMPRALG